MYFMLSYYTPCINGRHGCHQVRHLFGGVVHSAPAAVSLSTQVSDRGDEMFGFVHFGQCKWCVSDNVCGLKYCGQRM